SVGMLRAPFGIVGLETAFPLLYTHLVKTGKVTLRQLIDWLTINPAEIFNLPNGKLAEKERADLTLIDLQHVTKIDKNEFLSKGKNTPFQNWEVSGRPILTIAEGTIVYQEMEEVHEKTPYRSIRGYNFLRNEM